MGYLLLYQPEKVWLLLELVAVVRFSCYLFSFLIKFLTCLDGLYGHVDYEASGFCMPSAFPWLSQFSFNPSPSSGFFFFNVNGFFYNAWRSQSMILVFRLRTWSYWCKLKFISLYFNFIFFITFNQMKLIFQTLDFLYLNSLCSVSEFCFYLNC